MIEKDKERKKGKRRDIEREGEIRERGREREGERGIERASLSAFCIRRCLPTTHKNRDPNPCHSDLSNVRYDTFWK